MSEQWGLRPKGEHPRLVSDLQLLHEDYKLLMMVHGEAVKQVCDLAAGCRVSASMCRTQPHMSQWG